MYVIDRWLNEEQTMSVLGDMLSLKTIKKIRIF